MYTFDTSVGGRDEAGGVNNSMTNYYLRKYIYLGWNKSDDKLQTMPKSIFYLRWTQMCLAFAEAANRVSGPTQELFGHTPKEAIAYLRNRTAPDGRPGVGVGGDPYLDECAAAGAEAFEKLVRNERRIELCFEGQRFYDLRRWATSVGDLNEAVRKPVISTAGISYDEVESRNFESLYVPIPYTEMVRMKKMVQNEGWSNWE